MFRFHHFDEVLGAASGVGVWVVGVVSATPTLQWVGLAVSACMVGVGVSKEIRLWLDRRERQQNEESRRAR